MIAVFGCSIAFLLLAVCCIHLRQKPICRGRLPLPPGPPTSWFGHVRNLPNSYQWLKYAEWRKSYGDLIFIHAFGNPLLVLNSAKVACDLLEKRGTNYSSRPYRIMVQELMGFDWLFSSLPYGPLWKKHRQIFQRHFHLNKIPSFHSVFLQEVRVLLHNLDQSPDNFSHHVKRTATGIQMYIVYGHKVSEDSDVYVALAEKALTGLGSAGILGTYLVDYIPFLKYIPAWFPYAKFQREAREWRKASRDMLDRPFQMVQDKMSDGTAVSCFTVTELERRLNSEQGNPEDHRVIKQVAATTYAAGADTTATVIMSFFLAMAIHPKVQQKAQQEIDAILKYSRLPTLEDKVSLPYITSIVMECLRWNPVTPLGIAHFVSEDDEYNGFFIPKGTIVLPNVWQMLHDETVYPDPLGFNPDRFEDAAKNKKLNINPEPVEAFGFSRRSCPGKEMAFEIVWLSIASVLSVFNISNAVGEDGLVIGPMPGYTSSGLSHPKPFRCTILPRSRKSLSLIRETSE